MKNRISKRNWRTVALCVMLIAAMAISLAACKQQGDANVTISLSKSSMQLDVYETFVLTAEVTGSQETPVWTVEDSSVATVDNGTVTAVQEGTTVVTATVGKASASCSVQVVNSYVAPVLMVNTPDIALGLNESYTVEVGVRYNGEAVTEPLSFNWELCDDAQEESVSLVPNERGAEITALSYGTTAYTVSTTYRGMVLAQRINIKVTNLDITFDIANLEKSAFAYKAELGLFKTDKDITEIIPVVTVYDKGVKVEDPTITWISLDQDIATVSEDGKIVGVSAGTARIVGQYDHADIAINAVIYRSMVEKKNVDVEQATGYVLSTSRFAGAGEVTDVLFNGESVLKEIKDGALYLNDEMLPSIGKPVELSVIAEKAEFVTEGTMATFVINSESELNRFPRYAASYPNGYYILGNDIQCGGTYSSNVTEPFLGTFDGRGHAIYNFTTSSENRFGRGLFGETFGAPGANEATIKDIAFINANHSGTGAMIAQIGGGLMENVYINVSLTDLKTGGGHSSTTVLFSYMYGSLETKQVLIEHNIPMVNVGETGYALTNLGEYGKFSGLYIIGADNVYHQLVDSQSGADRYGAYPTYRDFIQSGRSMGGWGNTFWATIGAVAYPRGRNIHASYMPTVTAAAETLSGTTVAIENLGFLDEVVLSTETKKLGVKVENNLIIIPDKIPDDSVLDITVRSVFNYSNAVKLSVKVDYAKQMMLDEQVLVSKRTAEIFRIDLSCFAEELEGFLIQSASVDGKNFSSVTYADGMLTLDTATLGDMVEEGQIFANFAKGNDLALVKINIFASDMAICSAEDLQRFPEIMQKYPSGYYILGDDIDYTGYTYTNNNDVSFTGIFDGRGYTIYNLRTKTSASDALHGFFGMNFGLEGAPQHSATLRNISFVGATVWGKGAFLAMNGSGTLENVFVYCTIEDLVADVNDPNPWYNSTSILFNKGKWYLTADKVIVEYKEPLTDNNGWGYAVGFPDNVGEFDNFYVVGADQYYGQLGTTSAEAGSVGCYANRTDFVAAKNNLTAWDGNGFWTVVDGFPIPNRLVDINLDKPFGEPVELAGMTYVDTAAGQATFMVDFGEQKALVEGAELTDASVEGKKFTTRSYADGILTLDCGTVSEMAGEKTVILTFEKGSKKITVHAKIAVCTMLISDADELSMFPTVMKKHPDGYYALDNHIDYAGYTYSNNATIPFTGTFDGRGYTIFNFCSKTSATDATGGFFGELFATNGNGLELPGTLKNISFVGATVKGYGGFLGMKGQGTLENVYIQFDIENMQAGAADGTQNHWYHSTSILFNIGYWNIPIKNVVVEYKEPLNNPKGWGYAFGQIYGSYNVNDFLIVGADNFYQQGMGAHYSTMKADCYLSRDDLKAKAPDLSTFENDFWTIVEGYPVPKKLVNYVPPAKEETVDLSAVTCMEPVGSTFTVDFGEEKGLVAGMSLQSAKIGGKAFAVADYNNGIVTLDVATVQDMVGESTASLVFKSATNTLIVRAKIIVCTKVIRTAEELRAFPDAMKKTPDGYFALGNDIDFAGYTYSNNATIPFTGTFDGRGYTIFNFCSKTSATDATGGFFGELFGTNGNGLELPGTLKNISFVDATVKGYGGFLGMKGQGTLENVYIQFDIENMQAGAADGTQNHWYHSTSILFNIGYWNINIRNVVVEYKEPLNNPNGWGYAFGQIYGSQNVNNFLVVGADNFYQQGMGSLYNTMQADCYTSRDDLKAKAPDLSAFENDFWTIVDGCPVPKKLANQ